MRRVTRQRLRPRSRGGYFSTDALIGLILVAALAAALAVATARQRRSSQHFGDAREAVHLAERAMLELQTGKPAPTTQPAGGDVTLSVRPLADPAPQGSRWVEISTSVRGRRATLMGLAPAPEEAAR
jgi:hypothetical protein